ncbi:MAG: hypothetical protein WDZ94_03285 [Patescibacteria group bacterium]
MTRPRKNSQKRHSLFRKKVYGASVLAFFLVACFALLSAFNQDQDIRQFAQTSDTNNPNCSEFSQSWGEWCVYTFTDSVAEPILTELSRVSSVSTWLRDGVRYLVVGGANDSQTADSQIAQDQDAIFLFQSSDDFGLADWQLVPGRGVANSLFDTTIETADSANLPEMSDADWSEGAFQVTQPSVVPVEMLPELPDGGAHECCDTIQYLYDYTGDQTQRSTSIHQASILPWDVSQVRRAGEYGHRNPILSWKTYHDAGAEEVVAVRDGKVVFDERSQQFYMVHLEQHTDASTQISLAQSAWPNLNFILSHRGILEDPQAAEPQIIVGPDSNYYLFYTRIGVQDEIWVAQSPSITGPYTDQRQVLQADIRGGISSVATPFVFCNSQIDQWQMYFIGENDGAKQLYTAFLSQACDQAPVL